MGGRVRQEIILFGALPTSLITIIRLRCAWRGSNARTDLQNHQRAQNRRWRISALRLNERTLLVARQERYQGAQNRCWWISAPSLNEGTLLLGRGQVEAIHTKCRSAWNDRSRKVTAFNIFLTQLNSFSRIWRSDWVQLCLITSRRKSRQ